MFWLNRSRLICGGDVAGSHLAGHSRSIRRGDMLAGERVFGFLFLACLLLGCSFAIAEEGTGENARAEKTTAITAADVDLWVRNLDSDHYADRQAAMKNLRRSGTVGIPALAAAARGSNLESTARSIELLTQMYESADVEVALAADEALESLGEGGPAVAVIRTQQALSTTLAQNRRRHAIAAVKRMGGSIIPRTARDDEEGEKDVELDLNDEGTIANVILGRRWTGGLNGVKYLQRLPDLQNLIMTKDLPLTLDEQDQLRAKLAGVRIELRGSAYLGIKSQLAPNQELCLVDHVVPKSPADLGGLLARDEITHLDGMRVNNFPALTELLSTKHGGDVVYLEICRGDEFLELEVTLREW